MGNLNGFADDENGVLWYCDDDVDGDDVDGDDVDNDDNALISDFQNYPSRNIERIVLLASRLMI